MKGIVSIIVCCVFLIACSNETTSLYGRLNKIEEKTFIVECSDQVQKTENYTEDIGYSCAVVLTDNTTFRNLNREELSAKDFQTGVIVQVILTEAKIINRCNSSRQVEAKEIVLIDE
ncbi:hypothetical protein [Ureibacillus chungkukjangi]|uniref:Lipoprotein n=1 Tax=Ureibacillus chungkukjangi TaxID=1202712 RepID=A0A318TR18_9BACL|nr:hypothetical protein [Ureibacillus chungkukjangi]PYF06250.1 hypothetical protein BJ095_11181 [Ureibacillus chungkukjangi]